MASRTPAHQLTDRELTILQLVAAGLSNQEIADQLVLGLTTVKWYLKQIYDKLGAKRRTQAVTLARSQGLIERDAATVDFSLSIPAPITPSIGREREIDEVFQLLTDSAARLVTLLGPGGIGKTHLALEIARQHADRMAEEVCFVALEAVDSLSGVAPAIAAAIGFQLHGNLDPGQQLLAGLRSRKLLLVLDNCEQVLMAAPYFSQILAAAPRLKLLTTSRERLNLRAETVYALRGLEVPSESAPNAQAASFQLFMEAALRVQVGFKPTEAESHPISRICQLVEGMPLGLVMAASWLHLLTPEQIADEIANSLAILQTTSHDIPTRHRSMEAVFEQSWRLLSDDERAAFMKLSVFRGGFDRAAAHAVAGASLFMLSTLVDKSLVTRVGSDRFKLHELVRQFAEAKLQIVVSEYTETLHRHCGYFAHLMRRYERDIKTNLSSFSQSLLSLGKDLENIVIAWQHALDTPFAAEVSHYFYCTVFLLYSHGMYSFGEATFAQAFKLIQSQAERFSSLDRVRVRSHYGYMLEFMSRYQEAEKVLLPALDLVGELDEAAAADAALIYLALGAVTQGNDELARARQYLQQGLAFCQKAEYEFGEWLGYTVLAEVEYDEGFYDLAYRLHRQALLLSEKTGHTLGILYGYGFIGCTCCALGDSGCARDHLRHGLTLQRDLLIQWGVQAVDTVLVMVIGIAALFDQHDDPETAVELLTILLHHPQCAGVTERKARLLLARLQSRYRMQQGSTVRKAQAGQLSSHSLEPEFIVNVALIDRLLELTDAFAIT